MIGEFNRKLTLLDRYVLDLTADRQRVFDRRIALALGVCWIPVSVAESGEPLSQGEVRIDFERDVLLPLVTSMLIVASAGIFFFTASRGLLQNESTILAAGALSEISS